MSGSGKHKNQGSLDRRQRKASLPPKQERVTFQLPEAVTIALGAIARHIADGSVDVANLVIIAPGGLPTTSDLIRNGVMAFIQRVISEDERIAAIPEVAEIAVIINRWLPTTVKRSR